MHWLCHAVHREPSKEKYFILCKEQYLPGTLYVHNVCYHCTIFFPHRSAFLDALASLDFKLSVSESVSNICFSDYFTASASTGLLELF